MELAEVYENLCTKDPRSPYWSSLYVDDDDDDPPPEPRGDCYCDNCFYGRDKLALEILRLRNIVETSNPLR